MGEAIEAPEREIALDLARRGLLVGPALIAICAVFWGYEGLTSSLLAVVLVILNFLAGAWLIGWSARISPSVLMATTLGGFVLRLGIITLVVLAVRSTGWFEPVPFALTLLITHLGLLAWETKYVSATLAYPGLKPSPDAATGLVPEKE